MLLVALRWKTDSLFMFVDDTADIRFVMGPGRVWLVAYITSK